jgi:hypothetical protein
MELESVNSNSDNDLASKLITSPLFFFVHFKLQNFDFKNKHHMFFLLKDIMLA